MTGEWTRPVVLLGCCLTLVLSAGCEPSGPMFGGEIEYRNRSKEIIYVTDLTGFKRPVKCGYLLPDRPAALSLGWMKYPREAMIVWRVEEGAEKSQVLDLGAVLADNPTATLVLEYTKAGEWKVTAERRQP